MIRTLITAAAIASSFALAGCGESGAEKAMGTSMSAADQQRLMDWSKGPMTRFTRENARLAGAMQDVDVPAQRVALNALVATLEQSTRQISSFESEKVRATLSAYNDPLVDLGDAYERVVSDEESGAYGDGMASADAITDLTARARAVERADRAFVDRVTRQMSTGQRRDFLARYHRLQADAKAQQ